MSKPGEFGQDELKARKGIMETEKEGKLNHQRPWRQRPGDGPVLLVPLWGQISLESTDQGLLGDP